MRADVYVKFAESLSGIERRKAVYAKLASCLFTQKTAQVTNDTQNVQLPAPKPSAPLAPEPVTQTPKTPGEFDITPVQRLHNYVKPYLNPSGVGGSLMMGLGGAMAGYGMLGGGSRTNRLLQLLMGGLLAYGGYKVFSDPRIRGLVNQYGSKAISAIGNWARTNKLQAPAKV